MKKTICAIACGAGLLLGSIGTLTAQEPTTQEPRSDRAAQTENRARGQAAGRLDERTSGATVRASKLIGMEIQNAEGKEVGEINDLVIDASNGRLRYAAVTYGGFLGFGNKMFAVPFEAFRFQPDPEDRNEVVLLLNVSEQQLEGAVGFDEDSWPNFGDRNFTQDLDRRYGVERRMQQRQRGVDGVDGAPRRQLGNPQRRTDVDN